MMAFGSWISEFWHYRELFYFLVWRDIKVRYKQSLLGGAWAILQPVITMVVFTIFFGKLAKMPSDGVPYPIFSYSALLPWTYFSTALTLAGNSLVNSKQLLTKVYFPRAVIPASSVLAGVMDFLIASLILVGMMFYYNFQPGWGLLLWPVLLLPLVILALSMGMILASLNVRFRDIKHAIPFVVQIGMFMTPIIYPTSIIPEAFRQYVALNPLVGIIEAFRASIIPTKTIDWNLLGTSGAVIAGIFICAIIFFRRTERSFADII